MKIRWKNYGGLTFCLLCFFQANSQVTLRVQGLPKNTPNSATIFVAGSMNGWNPGDSSYLLKRGSDGKWAITIPEGKGTVEYKFTLGDWAKVEVGPLMEDISNRKITFTGKPQTIAVTIESWKGTVKSTAQSNVRVLDTAFFMPQLKRNRRIWLYLPPDYLHSSKRYPVIYMHDGQNLFDQTTSFSGEWGIDETMNRLHALGDYGAIVIGIDNGGAKRLDEYSPWKNPRYGGGEGDAYISFIAETLKPFIDSNYRTLQGPDNTCIFGSSMGALISLYGATRYPEIFGKAGSFSPAYWFSFKELESYIQNRPYKIKNLQVIQIAGEKESKSMTAELATINDLLKKRGIRKKHLRIVVDAEGQHNEAYWRKAFPDAYKWLFPKQEQGLKKK